MTNNEFLLSKVFNASRNSNHALMLLHTLRDSSGITPEEREKLQSMCTSMYDMRSALNDRVKSLEKIVRKERKEREKGVVA
ncbi:MAG: hypothetical protein DELT_00527 [Desulfovibrio sp.]